MVLCLVTRCRIFTACCGEFQPILAAPNLCCMMTRADAFGGPTSNRVLILAPQGRDAQVASRLLGETGWPTFVCADIGSLCPELSKGAACAVITEEAIVSGNLDKLAAW